MAEGCGGSRARMVQKNPGVPVPVVVEGTSQRCSGPGCAGQRRDESSRGEFRQAGGRRQQEGTSSEQVQMVPAKLLLI